MYVPYIYIKVYNTYMYYTIFFCRCYIKVLPKVMNKQTSWGVLYMKLNKNE